MERPWDDLITFLVNSEKPRDAAMRNTGTGFVVLSHHSLLYLVLVLVVVRKYLLPERTFSAVTDTHLAFETVLPSVINVSMFLYFLCRRPTHVSCLFVRTCVGTWVSGCVLNIVKTQYPENY